MKRVTIATIVHKKKGAKLDKFFWGVNRYGESHKVLIVMGKDHGVKDPEKLRDKYKNLDIEYHYTQVEPTFENLLTVAENELDTNSSIYLDLEKPGW